MLRTKKETLEGVVEARSKATQIKVDANDLTPGEVSRISESTGSRHIRIGQAACHYRKLSGPEKLIKISFELQAQLEGTENRINVARKTLTMLHKLLQYIYPPFPKSIFLLLYSASRNVPISKPPKEREKHRK